MRFNLRRSLLFTAAILALWFTVSPSRIAEYRDIYRERTEISPLDVAPVAYRCEIGPRVYCSADRVSPNRTR